MSDDLLKAIAHAGDEDLPADLEQALADPETLSTAIEIVQGDPQWCERVYKLLLSGEQAKRGAHHNDAACARYLGRHAYQVPEVIHYLLSQKSPHWDVLIELALAHRPERLPDFLPRALRSWQEHRLTASAVLALLDTPWSRGVLVEHLNATKSQDRTYEARAALRECQGEQGNDAARCWEERHPEERAAVPADDRFDYSFDGGIHKVLLDRMGELAELVQGVRNRLPQGEPG